MIYLVLLVLFFAVYTSWRVDKIAGVFGEAIDSFNEEIKTLKALAERSESVIPADWVRDLKGWGKSDEEGRMPLDNPNPLASPDAFSIAQIGLELRSLAQPQDRVKLLEALRYNGAYFGHELKAVVFSDESPRVRAWGASHLDLKSQDYSEYKNPKEAVDFEPQIVDDPEPVVRASRWLNEDYGGLPWTIFHVPENWKDMIKGMTQLEKLALVRNHSLQDAFVVALLDTPSEELGMTRAEHAKMLYGAATNVRIIWGSRRHGRDYWMVEGDVSGPSKEYGQMWELSLSKWLDVGYVPYNFLKYVQTTPKTKVAVYQRLFDLPKEEYPHMFRKAIIEGCDPIKDRDLLKIAWDDEDKDCRAAARLRVGNYAKFIGVSDTPKKT